GTEKLYGFYRVILSSFAEKDENVAKAELIDYLPRLSETGSGDDVSIGIIADRELLRVVTFEPEQPEPETGEPQEGQPVTEGDGDSRDSHNLKRKML
ncbi:MAG: hypothetical protein LBH42_00530, partial [Treponema sp.]|nr:hypothetical protein [Treponema sp.]